MFLSDEDCLSASEEYGGMGFLLLYLSQIKLFLSEGSEEEDGGMGGLMFLSEEAALQTDSSVSTAFRLIQGF